MIYVEYSDLLHRSRSQWPSLDDYEFDLFGHPSHCTACNVKFSWAGIRDIRVDLEINNIFSAFKGRYAKISSGIPVSLAIELNTLTVNMKYSSRPGDGSQYSLSRGR